MENLADIASALCSAQLELTKSPIEKNKQVKVGNKYSFKYADLSSIIHNVTPILAKHGLCISSPCESDNNVLSCRLIHTSGQEIVSTITIPRLTDPKDQGGVLTYYRRYLLCGILNIFPSDDLDGLMSTTPEEVNFSDVSKAKDEKGDNSDLPEVSPMVGVDTFNAKIQVDKPKKDPKYGDEIRRKFGEKLEECMIKEEVDTVWTQNQIYRRNLVDSHPAIWEDVQELFKLAKERLPNAL